MRGVNISGKNKAPMAEWKKGFEDLGLRAMKTYLNNGNAAFSNGEDQAGVQAGSKA